MAALLGGRGILPPSRAEFPLKRLSYFPGPALYSPVEPSAFATAAYRLAQYAFIRWLAALRAAGLIFRPGWRRLAGRIFRCCRLLVLGIKTCSIMAIYLWIFFRSTRSCFRALRSVFSILMAMNPPL